jgi:hypothetical protein
MSGKEVKHEIGDMSPECFPEAVRDVARLYGNHMEMILKNREGGEP